MTARIFQGDALTVLRTLPAGSVQCCITSPPYWGLRDYGVVGQLGLERTPEEYVSRLVKVFREVRRVLRRDGTLWVNLGDSYATGAGKVGACPGGGEQGERWNKHHMPQTPDGKNPNCSVPTFQPNRMPIPGLKPKDLVGIPWRVAFALQADGWWLRSDIIWSKPNPMPESVTDRPTKAHEYLFLLTKSARYYYDAGAIKEPAVKGAAGSTFHEGKTATHQLDRASEKDRVEDGTRNRRSVWTIPTQPFPEAHFATFPEALVEPCILAGCPAQCCPKCGKGYERITESTKTFESGSGRSGNPINGKQDLTASKTNSTPDIRKGPCVQTRTLGFRPACDCGDAASVPGTVLDPFAGSGTVGAVAVRCDRRFLGIELSPSYCEMARRRIDAVAPMFIRAEVIT